MSIQERLVDLVDWVTQTIRNLRFRSLEVEVKSYQKKRRVTLHLKRRLYFWLQKKTALLFKKCRKSNIHQAVHPFRPICCSCWFKQISHVRNCGNCEACYVCQPWGLKGTRERLSSRFSLSSLEDTDNPIKKLVTCDDWGVQSHSKHHSQQVGQDLEYDPIQQTLCSHTLIKEVVAFFRYLHPRISSRDGWQKSEPYGPGTQVECLTQNHGTRWILVVWMLG